MMSVGSGLIFPKFTQVGSSLNGASVGFLVSCRCGPGAHHTEETPRHSTLIHYGQDPVTTDLRA